ncbi:MAG: hypothetical protein JKY60_06520 [Kordiimonadaceae bacterium]|nr:hypothetical protein [Kordiimonadaceae bacterium]
MNAEFKWCEELETICDAPLSALTENDLDAQHPAGIFNAYWNKIGGGSVPDKSMFSPKDVPAVLKWFMLFRREIIDGVDRYHLFLQGSSAAEMTGGWKEGKYLHDFTTPDCYVVRRDMMRGVIEAGTPGYARIMPGSHGEYEVDVTTAMFPLTEGEGRLIFAVPAPTSLQIRRLI